MFNIKVFGVGAAGNKAAIKLIESKILPRQNVFLLNTTSKDVPQKYQDEFFIEFGDVKGCGKERELAKTMMIESLNSEQIPIESMLDGDEKFFVIVTSTEGGTGSGSSIVLGEYLQELTGAPVHLISFLGFQDDIKGLGNSVDWFNELNPNFIVQTISNKKCLDLTDNNRKKAEQRANEIFCKRIEILTGKYINPSETNIDDTDLLKMNSIPGYMSVEYTNLEKIKDQDQFNTIIRNTLENSVSLETEPSAKIISVITTASEKTIANIDNSYKVIKDKYGFPIELFQHQQDATDIEDNIAIVASGMKLPIDEIKSIYSKFKTSMEKIDNSEDNFFNNKNRFNTGIKGFDVGKLRTNLNSDLNKRKSAKSNFFSKYGINAKEKNVAKTTINIGNTENEL